ncbi:MFS transporter [Nocardioides sp. LHG3406-4]|uniref:MFS transporter n=1 Tax=Nocardioides sp. LHG3406-4 TaxID=2804575 RepID=UPI003CEBF7EC
MTTTHSSTATRPRPTVPGGVAFASAAITFTSIYLATGALTPLLVVYREEWGFPATQLTLAFAVYAVGFLAALLTLGGLSDHVGRRPVLIGALLVQIASNVMFLVAPGIEWVIAGRIVQGVAQGAATTAFTAALVELAPPARKRLGAILGSVGVTLGLGAGSLVAGFAIQVTETANAVIFTVLTIVTILGTVVVGLSPETVSRAPGAVRSLVPRISLPLAARAEFAAAAPVIAAIWMLAGLSGGLAPSMIASVFHHDSGLLNGTAGFIAPATSAVVGLAFARVDPRRAMTIGIYASIVGALGIIGGVLAGSLAVMFLGQAVAGLGFGASFTAALRLVLPLAGANQRAGVVSGIYVVSYLALGIPIIVVGQLTESLGIVSAVVWYSAATVLLAFISLAGQLHLQLTGRRVGGGEPSR